MIRLNVCALLITAAALAAPPPVRILIAYHSQTGNTEKLAAAVRDGAASVPGVEVMFRKTAEASAEDIQRADGLVVGTPVHWGTLSADTKSFLDRVGVALGLGKKNPTLGEGRTAAVLCTAGGPAGGQDTARLSVIAALLHMRFAVLGGVTGDGFGVLGPQAIGGKITPSDLADARRSGERFARFTKQLRPPQPTVKSADPEVSRLVAEVSSERIAASMRELGGFRTRDLHSATDSPTEGIGAARRWLAEELKSYSPRLEVRADVYPVKKQGRVLRDLELVNVVAVLPGATQKERQVILGAHYDSLSLARGTDAATRPAPGVSDNASGVASVLEAARVMSRREWKKTLVFVLFAGEEQGLLGSRLHADRLLQEKAAVDAMLNLDIIGDETAGNGQTMSHAVRLFSNDPNDSPSRALARFVREMAERYVPAMKVDLVFRADRFGRGGDHTPFAQRGYPAVRFTEPNENYAHQHSADDAFENSAPEYTTRVARVNLAAAACLALAPRTPVVAQSSGAPMLGRGKSGYDAALRWTHAPEPDLAGFAVVIRSTTAPFWEREIFAGNEPGFTLENLSIDDLVIGVKAVSKAGFESPVAAYVAVDRADAKIALAGP